MKGYISKGFAYYVSLFAGLWLGMLLGMAAVIPLRFFLPKGSVGESAVMMLLALVCIVGCLFVGAFRAGYKAAAVSLKNVLLPMVIALLIQLLYAVILSFAVYTAGPAYWLGDILSALGDSMEESVPDVYVFGCMLLFDPAYIGIALIGERMGAKKRAADRAKLTRG